MCCNIRSVNDANDEELKLLLANEKKKKCIKPMLYYLLRPGILHTFL